MHQNQIQKNRMSPRCFAKNAWKKSRKSGKFKKYYFNWNQDLRLWASFELRPTWFIATAGPWSTHKEEMEKEMFWVLEGPLTQGGRSNVAKNPKCGIMWKKCRVKGTKLLLFAFIQNQKPAILAWNIRPKRPKTVIFYVFPRFRIFEVLVGFW